LFTVSRLNKLLILVRDLDDIKEVMSLPRDVTMVIPVYEGCGAGYYSKLLAASGKGKSSLTADDVIFDCSNSFRDAVEAMRLGAKLIKVTDDYKAYYKVIDIAGKYGAKVITSLPGKVKELRKKNKK